MDRAALRTIITGIAVSLGVAVILGLVKQAQLVAVHTVQLEDIQRDVADLREQLDTPRREAKK